MEPRDVGAIVLAAGAGRRMGGRPKGGLRLPEGDTFVERIVRTAREAGLRQVIVVRGAAPAPDPPGALCVENPQGAEAGGSSLPAGEATKREGPAGANPAPEEGMLSSVLRGISALRPGTEAALVWPVDCPRVPARAVRALVEAAAAAGAPVAVPRHAGRRGHPALFAASVFPELRTAPPDQGARAVVRAHARAGDLLEVDVDAPEVLDDLDTPGDLPPPRGQA